MFLKSIMAMLLFLFLLPAPARAQEGVFRDFVWGVSPADVMKFESATFYKKEGDSLVFLEKPDIFRRLITYDFKDGKLWRAKYEYADMDYPNPQIIIDIFGDEERKLTAKLGKPLSEEFLWKDKTYMNYPQFWGRALLSRDLKLRARWQTKDTEAELQTFNGQDHYETFYTMQRREEGTANQSVDIFTSPEKLQ